MRRALRFIRSLVLILAAVIAPWAEAQPISPGDLLMRMSEAMHRIDFQGVMVYQHDDRLDSLRIFHAGAEVERERLVSLNGSAREVVRENGAVVCYQDGAPPFAMNAASQRSLVPLVPLVRSVEIGSGYQATLRDGVDRIAGYTAYVIDLKPKDRYRYGYRLWLEKNSHLMLRAMLIGSRGVPIEQVMFVSVEIGASPRAQDLATSFATIVPPATTGEMPELGPARWIITDLPAGFAISSRLALVAPGRRGEHLLVSDGIANVSVYIESAPPGSAKAAPGSASRGALNVFAREFDGHLVTVLGDVPSVTVERIANAVSAAQ